MMSEASLSPMAMVEWGMTDDEDDQGEQKEDGEECSDAMEGGGARGNPGDQRGSNRI